LRQEREEGRKEVENRISREIAKYILDSEGRGCSVSGARFRAYIDRPFENREI